MAYYRICPKCGCSLDPGEQCDCEEEAAREHERRKKLLEGLIVQERNSSQLVLNFDKEVAV